MRSSVRWVSASLLLVAWVGGPCGAQGDWREGPSPSEAGPFPIVRPFEGSFRFGWSGIEAARAVARVWSDGGKVSVRVEGGTVGAARALWRLDAVHSCEFEAEGLRPLRMEQVERYARRSITTVAEFGDGRVRRQRQPSPGPPAKWKTVRFPGIRDMVSAMFFIRSQPLEPGDLVRTIAFPGDAPFVVEAEVIGRELLAERPVLRIRLRIQRLKLVKGEEPRLEPHRKFRRATVWLSDDADRVPLRAEAEIFIGTIFGELEQLTFLR